MRNDVHEFDNKLLTETYDSRLPLYENREFLLDLTKEIKAKKIIDIGCGTGLLTNEFIKEGYEVIGIEPNDVLDIAKRNHKDDNVTWIKGYAKDLEGHEADFAFMTGHVAQFHLTDKDWNEALKGVNRSLKLGGYFCFESRNPNVKFWEKKDGDSDSWLSKEDDPAITNDSKYGRIESWILHKSFEDMMWKYELHYNFIDQGEKVVVKNTLKFRTQEELTKSLEEAGFEIINVYGDFDKREVSEDCPEFVFVVEKK